MKANSFHTRRGLEGESSRGLSYSDYTTGWMCSTMTDVDAAMVFLDEEHPILPPIEPRGPCSYVLGRICRHNVVITFPSADVAAATSNMIHSVPAIRYVLRVGIAGGAPYHDKYSTDSEDGLDNIGDIRLGDVVISPDTVQCEPIICMDLLQEPVLVDRIYHGVPPIVSSAVSAISRDIQGPIFPMVLLESMEPRFQYPASNEDCLFKSTIIHGYGDETCENCHGPLDINIVKRKDRRGVSPRIHHGCIASANVILKDAILRDKLARKHGVLCFELGGAELMDGIPCLVICGICDYADSHINTRWQPYAGVTAASYARVLLGNISRQHLISLAPLNSYKDKLTGPRT
ncbi:nucleoside phosphorylase domain-containing protein [Aspergillus varians]